MELTPEQQAALDRLTNAVKPYAAGAVFGPVGFAASAVNQANEDRVAAANTELARKFPEGEKEGYHTPDQAEVGTDIASAGSQSDRSLMDVAAGAMVPMGGGGPGKVAVPGFRNNDIQGREPTRVATVDAPKQAQDAAMAHGADESAAQAQIATTQGELRDAEVKANAVAEARRAREMVEYDRRVKAIDDQANRIAAHQVNGGDFFSTPGSLLNIIGAMFMVGASNDKTIGVKLINQYIDREAKMQQQRHENMQADLLNLRTNVGEYRHLMGSKEAGDMMHSVKMKEVAAMKIQEISSQLKSKEALTTANFATAKLRQDAAILQMRANQIAYHAASMQDPALAKMMLGGDVDVFGPKPGGGATAAAGAQGAKGPAMTKPEAAAAGGVISSQTPDGRTATTKVDTESDRMEQRKAFDFQQRTGIPAAYYGVMKRQAIDHIKSIAALKSGGNPNKHNSSVAEQIEGANTEQTHKAMEHLQPVVRKASAVNGLRANIARLEADPAFKLPDGKTVDYHAINEALGRDWIAITGPNLQKKLNEITSAWSRAGVPPDLVEMRRQAITDFAQSVQLAIVDYGHEKAGAALSGARKNGQESELSRLEMVLSSRDGFQSIKNAVDGMSRIHGDEFRSAMTALTPAAKLYILEYLGNTRPAMGTRGTPGVR